MKDHQLAMSLIEEQSKNGMLKFDMGDGIIASISLKNATLVFAEEDGQPVIHALNPTIDFHLQSTLQNAA